MGTGASGNPMAAMGLGSREDVLGGLRALLNARGVSDGEFDQAVSEDRLDLLVADRLLLRGSERLTAEQVSESSGMPIEQAERLWRALGFPEPDGEAVFTSEDAEALCTIRGLSTLGVSSEETAIQVTRVLGQSMARVADAQISAADNAAEALERPDWATDEDDGILLAQAIAFSAEVVFPSMEQLILHAWRRHIQAASLRRASMRRDPRYGGSMLTELTVGFADMVGFTALSSQLSGEELAEVVDRFEDLAHSTVVDGGGRPVKMIGDEVMFVATDPLQAVRIGLDLVEAYADDELLSDVRVGLALGPVLMREGDFFGSVVNRAHRTVSIADAGTVLCGDEIYVAVSAIEDGTSEITDSSGEPLHWEALKPRELKDLGTVSLWQVSRGVAGVTEGRRTGLRWRRLSPHVQAPRVQAPRVQAARILPQGSAS